jgi:hypothetical protein
VRAPESGRADVAALGAALLLGGAALLPGILLRGSGGWRKCGAEALSEGPGRIDPDPLAGPLATAAGARTLVATSLFRPDPGRVAGPLPDPTAAPAVPVRDLAGRVADGRLHLRWRPAPGSSGTQLRVEGLGGPGILEMEIEAGRDSVEVPVPGVSGTSLVRALPLGTAGAGAPGRPAEARVSIPYRIPVEAVRATAASAATGSALLVLRRPYDGRLVEGEFPLREADPVGGLSPAGPGGPVIDFRTDLVLEAVRAAPPAAGSPRRAPRFLPDGRVERGEDGLPLDEAGTDGWGTDVVLRGPDDRRQVLPVPAGGR